jgi:glycosyltransferase involved in cell wall biosynthesis
MKILYDYQAFSYQNYGGVSRYYFELISRLGGNGISFELPAMYSTNHYARKLKSSAMIHSRYYGSSDWPAVNFACKMALKAKYGDVGSFNKMSSQKMIAKGDFDVFHPTNFDPYFLKHIGNKPFVLTIYDMIHELYPDHFDRDDPTSLRKKILAEKAAKVIAISNNTKKDILRFIDIDESKVQVIHLGNPLDPGESGPGPSNANLSSLPERYLLFVGTRDKYKNFGFFVESIHGMLKSDPRMEIVCVGGGAFSTEETAFLRKHGIDRRVRQYTVDDSTLAGLYKRAVGLVFPSRYEGFGIPVLEAFACGCPAIISNTSSLPEVGGDAAAYFDPDDMRSIRDAIEKVACDEELRKNMVSRGFEQLKKFSWDKTVSETVSVYKGVTSA